MRSDFSSKNTRKKRHLHRKTKKQKRKRAQTVVRYLRVAVGAHACLKKNLKASRPSEKSERTKTFEHPPDHRLQRQNLLMAFKRVPDGINIGSTA